MTALLISILACTGAADQGEDSGESDTGADACPGPAVEDFAAEYAATYCPWLQACPDPPDFEWSACERYYTDAWLGYSESYLPCRAQECLDYLRADLEACEDDGAEWMAIEECAWGYIAPGGQAE